MTGTFVGHLGNIQLFAGMYQLHGSRPTCKSVVHSISTRSFKIWNAISNVIDLNVSLFTFKYKTKTFLQNNELNVTI